MIPLKTFGIWGNTEKDSFWDTFPKIVSWADENGLIAHLTTRILKDENCTDHTRPAITSRDDIGSLDFMLALGGDGTFLSLARAMGHHQTPILRIHLGDLGFLANATKNNLFSLLTQVSAGNLIL